MVVDLLVPQFHMLKYDVFYKSKPRNIFGLQDVCMQFAGHLQAQTFFRLIDFNQKYHARVQQNSLTHQKLFRLKLLISFCIIKARYFCLFGTAVCSQFHHAQAHCKHRSCTIMLASFYNKRSYKSNGSPSFLFKSEFLVCSWMPAYLRKTILILLIQRGQKRLTKTRIPIDLYIPQ